MVRTAPARPLFLHMRCNIARRVKTKHQVIRNMLKTFAVLLVAAFVLLSPKANEKNLYRDGSLKYLNLVKDQQRLLQADSSNIISEENVKNENFCSLKCVKNGKCLSANLRRTDDGRLQCQLLKTDRYKEGVAKWKKDPNSVHMSVKVR